VSKNVAPVDFEEVSMNGMGRTVVKIIQGFLGFLAGAVAMGLLVMLVWNAVIPDVFHLAPITYWQAVLLLVLAHILFRGAGVQVRWHDHSWKKKFRDKISIFSPEERSQFHAEWERRCGEIKKERNGNDAPQ
jgi:hypothetical protein